MTVTTRSHVAVARGLPATRDVKGCARLVGVHPETVYESLRNGTFPVQPIRIGRTVRFSTMRVLDELGIDPSDLVTETLIESA